MLKAILAAALLLAHASLQAETPLDRIASGRLTGEQNILLSRVGDSDVFGPKEPSSLPDIKEYGFTWTDWLKCHVCTAIAEPVIYRNWRDASGRKSIALVYGLFSLGNVSDPFVDGARKEADGNYVWKKFRHLFKSEETQDLLIRWSVDNFAKAYETLPHEDRKVYDEIVSHAISYLAAFDLEKEKAYLDKVKDQPGKFTLKDPGGKSSPYRKLECMIFRRIESGDFTRDRLLFLAMGIRNRMAKWER